MRSFSFHACRVAGVCVALLASVLVHGGCKSPLEAFEGPGIHVLFIGNSLTYVNDLPATVQGLIRSGGEEMSFVSVAKPDFALIDHLDGGSDAVDEIKRGGWDYVVLQQGPSSLRESRDLLIQGTQRLNEHIQANGARPALYMVWPDKSRYSFFEDVRLSYKLAADTVRGIFFPAGEAWLAAWEENPQLALYGPDDFHPSSLGTFLAALVIYEGLTGRDARELPPQVVVASRTITVPEETVRLLQRAAHTTNEKYTGE